MSNLEEFEKRIESLEKQVRKLRRAVSSGVNPAQTLANVIYEGEKAQAVETGDPMRPYAVITKDGGIHYYWNESYAVNVAKKLEKS